MQALDQMIFELVPLKNLALNNCLSILAVAWLVSISANVEAQNDGSPDAAVVSSPAKEAFKRFRGLVGKHTPIGEPEMPGHVEYELWSRDSAILEKWVKPNGSSEFTVFSLDGDELLAIHFCAIGVQSRMKLTLPVKDGIYAFALVEVLNLPSPDAPHNSGFSYQFLKDGSVDRKEYWTKGEEVSASGLKLVRR